MNFEEMKDRLGKLPEPEWIRKMREHYTKTGSYRPEDLRRLLGDPTHGVEMSCRPSIPNYFAK